MVDREHTISTIEEFEAWVELPQNTDKLFEFIGGEIIEVAPSNTYASEVGFSIGFEIKAFLKAQGMRGHVTGEQGGYVVNGERYAPDISYISYARQPQVAKEGYNPNPPELAVEVDYPSTVASRRTLRIKLTNYLLAGTTVWVVLPETYQVEIYVPGELFRVIGINDLLTCEHILPGFQLSVKDIFPAED